jgi:hypothetical protein
VSIVTVTQNVSICECVMLLCCESVDKLADYGKVTGSAGKQGEVLTNTYNVSNLISSVAVL